MLQKPFWMGSRGEWYLVVQAFLFVMVIFGPHTCEWLTEWKDPLTWIGTFGGSIFLLAGLLLAVCGTVSLGKNLTPLPLPKKNALLIITGAYRFVRHPIYSGIIFMAAGWGLWLHSWLNIFYALLLFIFFDIKSRLEERLLEVKFPEYAAYRKRASKLIPWVY